MSRRLTCRKRPRAETRDEAQPSEGQQEDQRAEKVVLQQPNDAREDNPQHSSNERNTDPDSGIVPFPSFPDWVTELQLLAQYRENERWERELQEVVARAYHVEHAAPNRGSCCRVLTPGGWVWATWNGAYYLPL